VEKIIIEVGKSSDLPQVLELIHELAAYVGHAEEVANTVEQMEIDGFSENPIYGLFVARKGTEIIAAAIYYYRYSTWKGKRLYLEDLVVKSDDRGKGIGKRLFETTLKKSLSENCSGMMWQVVKDNHRAINFYEKYDAEFDEDFMNCSLESLQIKKLLNA
jgi:GNAT superfamily N-acetyltransferase